MEWTEKTYITLKRQARVRPRFFDQVGHENMYASSGNKHFFTKFCHRQTYQNYEQGRQKLGTILGNKVQLRGNQKDFNFQLHHRLSKFEVPVVVNLKHNF